MNQRELETHLQDLFDGQLSAQAFDELQQELRSDPKAREVYREYALLEHSLKFRSKGVDMMNVVPMDRVNKRRQRRAMKVAGFSAAAVLALAALVMTLIFVANPQPTLSFAKSPGTELVISHTLSGDSPPDGQAMEPGSRMQVASGTVELQFASGIRGIVQGPADLTLRREDLLELREGRAWFEVPSKAVGFQVVTPDLVLTDLGTEFGIISKSNFLDEVYVFNGKVEVFNRKGLKAKQTVTAGHAHHAALDGSWKGIPFRSDSFLTKLPKSGLAKPALHDSVTFTSSPENEMVRAPYIFAADFALSGFDPAGSDKLVVTLSHENGEITSVTYGGVAMVPAIQADSDGGQKTAIYYLDAPDGKADLVVNFDGRVNGVGGSLLALSNTATGGPVATNSAKATFVTLSTPVSNCFLIATHACNDHVNNTAVTAQRPMKTLFSGPTGSSAGGSAYINLTKTGKASAGFEGTSENPVTAAAAFAPIP